MRKTKIVATVGPACAEEKKLEAVIRAGADVLRINTSHAKPEELRRWMLLIRRISSGLGKYVSILVDLQGPRIRTGTLEGKKPLELKTGDEFVIISGSKAGSGKTITTLCGQFPKMVKKNDRVLLDNGLMGLQVLQVAGDSVRCRVLRGGLLGENKGINLPSASFALSTLTSKDIGILRIACALKADYIALSFVRSEKDILAVKKCMKKFGKEIPVIAKIEKPSAAEHIEPILKIADGIMVARGDLGIEMGVEKIPVVQKRLIEKANQYEVPVITATQMLESMMTQTTPLRAEASDIANAVFDGTDAVMLSGETAAGKYPVEAVKMMARIVHEAEKYKKFSANHLLRYHENSPVHGLPIQAMAHAACNAAEYLTAKAILVFTRSGQTAVLLSKLKPDSMIIALTPSLGVVRRLALLRGVAPILMKYVRNTDQMLREGDRQILRRRLLKPNDPVVVISGKHEMPGAHSMVKTHRIGFR